MLFRSGEMFGCNLRNTIAIPIEYIGTNDTFGESGKPTELLTKYGLDTPNIVAAAEKALSRKG